MEVGSPLFKKLPFERLFAYLSVHISLLRPLIWPSFRHIIVDEEPNTMPILARVLISLLLYRLGTCIDIFELQRCLGGVIDAGLYTV